MPHNPNLRKMGEKGEKEDENTETSQYKVYYPL